MPALARTHERRRHLSTQWDEHAQARGVSEGLERVQGQRARERALQQRGQSSDCARQQRVHARGGGDSEGAECFESGGDDVEDAGEGLTPLLLLLQELLLGLDCKGENA